MGTLTRRNVTLLAVLAMGLALAPAGLAGAQTSSAQLAFALTSGNALLRLNVASPGTVLGSAVVRGLQPGESLVGIDFRPANNALYGVGSTGRLYTVNPTSGMATQVGSQTLSPALTGTAFGVDFNPAACRLRVVSTSRQNLRINADTLDVINDGMLAYAPGDRNASAIPNVVAAGYTNNIAGTTSTMLYVIDSSVDVLANQNPPNDGVLNTVGALGVNAVDVTGFDIAPGSGSAFAALTQPGAGASTLYSINLNSGAATRIGAIGGGQTIRGLALVLDGTATLPAGPAMATLPRTGTAAGGATTPAGTVFGMTGAAAALLGAGIALRRRQQA